MSPSKLVLLIVLLLPAAALAERSPLELKADEVCTFLRPDPAGFEALFNAGFLAKVPKESLLSVTTSMVTQTGRCTAARVPTPGRRGEVFFTMEKGFEIPAQMSVEDKPPHLIEGLFLRPPVAQAASLDEVAGKLKALRGSVSVVATPLGGGKPYLAIHDEKPLAVGSAFKLYLLAEAGRQIAAGKRKPSDIVVLGGGERSFSSAFLEKWPKDAPLTLHTVATMMISRSDNTATDLMLETLGRDAVEAGLGASGHEHADGMRPFLSTRDVFRLKLVADDATRARWAKAGVAERRKILAALAGKLADVKSDPGDKPMVIETIEWFASAGDLCRVMNALRGQKGWRDILTVNPGLAIDAKKYPFIGFKGGSEPGVINLTFLLEDTAGKATCVAATWNDAAAPVDESAFAGLVAALIAKLP